LKRDDVIALGSTGEYGAAASSLLYLLYYGKKAENLACRLRHFTQSSALTGMTEAVIATAIDASLPPHLDSGWQGVSLIERIFFY
jgi:hypothetical protein